MTDDSFEPHSFESLHAELEQRTLIADVTSRLHREFAGVFGVETIERVVGRPPNWRER